MSATLATAGDDPFAYFKKSVGVDRYVVQKRVASPFDFENQALLYLPRDLPEPNQSDFMYAALNEIERIVELTQGPSICAFYKQKCPQLCL